MRVLITGGTGLLGKALLFTVPRMVQPAATYYREPPLDEVVTFPFYPLDIRDMDAVTQVFSQVRPDVVIHTASIGSVDYAEKNCAEALDVNVEGTRNVVIASREQGARVIFISSNAVFDGRHPPYREENAVCPINYYGEMKVAGEHIVLQASPGNVVIRPILMYGWPSPGRRGNLVTYWLGKLERGDPVQAVDNVWSNPLQVENCAEACWAVVTQERVGTYHVAGADHVTLYQFALNVADVFGYDADLVTPVPGSFFPQLAPRPNDTSFVTDKMEQELGVRPIGLAEGLICMKALRSQMQ